MTRPGDRLRALSARVVSARTMERLIDPVFADLHAEHADAVGLGYHQRWALSGAPLVLALFALSVIGRGQAGRLVLSAVAGGAFVGNYLLLFTVRALVLDGTLPASYAAWAPNAAFVLLAISPMAFGSQRSSSVRPHR